MKARKKPVEIDFYDFAGTSDIQMLFLQDWVRELGAVFEDNFILDPIEGLKVKTLEGTSYIVSTNDVIIMGVSKEFYPCKRDIFYKTYDVVE